MKRRLWVAGLLALVVPSAGAAGAGGERPRLELRASPRVATSPARVVVLAELKGGPEAEDLYCPAVQWEWGDGSRSARESDCDPFEAGTVLDRRFSSRHAYREPGEYDVRVTLSRGGRDLASASILVLVVGPDTTLGSSVASR
jgi:hypothetical protein